MRGLSLTGARLPVACLLAALLLAASGAATLHAQEVTVRGRVVDDATEQPVADASVVVQGTRIGARSDSAGRFALTVPSPDVTLVVSRIGYARSEVPLRGATEIVLRLSRTSVQLDEVVVVGYGTQKRSDITGAVSSINSEQLTDKPISDLRQALEGSVPGVAVTTTGAGAEPTLNFLIRGQKSITANTDPLVVIDGIPFDGSLSEINQSDIASIDILKDASASAIYGARGSNGVVIITTKRGFEGPPALKYDGYAGTLSMANVPELMTGPEFADFKCQRETGGVDCETAFTPTEWENLQAGRWTDWLDVATRTGFQQQHTLSVSGGTDDTRYYIAGSLLDVQGIARGDQFGRYSMRLNVDQRVSDWLRIGTNTQLSQTDRGGMPASFANAFTMNPLTVPYDENGQQLTFPWPEDRVEGGNPLQGFLVTDDDISRRVFTSNYAEVSIPRVEGLTYRLNGGIDFAGRDQGRYYPRTTRTGLADLGRATVDNDTRFDWTVENILRYSRDLAKHHVDVTGLYSAQLNTLEEDHLLATGFPNDVLTYRQANVALLLQPTDGITKQALVSQMGRLNYSYDGRYLLTLTARRDGSSVFGENNKYGVFPSMAAGWNVSRERFWPFADAFNMLKLRVSYGQSGNQAIRPYQTLSRLTEDSYTSGGISAPGYRPSTLGNPDLKWETTTQLNVGADFGFFKDRLQGTLDVYRSRTRDLLLDRLISPVHGITRITQNIGQTENRGVELRLTSVNVTTPSFTWSTDFNIAMNRNKIVDLYGTGIDDLANDWFIGQPIDVNYGLKFGGIWQEGDDIANSAQPTAKPGDVRVVDLNADGKIDDEDRTFIGSLEPDYTAALTNTLRYREFSLSFFLHSVQGVTRSNELLNSNLVLPDVRRNTVRLEYWTPENPINTYPANRENTNVHSVTFYEDASYVRLRDVTLAYDVPASLAERFGGRSLRVYVNGRNLWTHTDWSGLDPELGDQRALPLQRSVIAGVNLGF